MHAPLYDFCKGTQNFSIFFFVLCQAVHDDAGAPFGHMMSYERLIYKTFPIYILIQYTKKKNIEIEILYEKFFMNKMVL